MDFDGIWANIYGILVGFGCILMGFDWISENFCGFWVDFWVDFDRIWANFVCPIWASIYWILLGF